MRIVFVAGRYWPAVGGTESFVRHLAQELGARHSVTVLAQRIDDGPATRLSNSLLPPPSFKPFEDGPVRVEPLRIPVASQIALVPLFSQVVPGLRRYAYGRARIALAALYAQVVSPLIVQHVEGASAIHVWGGDLLAMASVSAARRSGIPVIITPFAHRGGWGDDPASAFAYRRADRVISLLEADAQLYRELGVAEDRLLSCPVSSPRIPGGGGLPIRSRCGISGPLVIYLGVRRPYKGVGLLLEAAETVAARAPKTSFAFVGPGPRLTVANSSIRIFDVGQVDDASRAAWLDAADLLCLPSASETFGVSILEAWSMSKAVVTSDIPSLRELVETAGGGLAVPRNSKALADAILSLLTNSSRLRSMGEAGHSFWARRCTVPVVAQWHEQLYGSIAKTSAKAAA